MARYYVTDPAATDLARIWQERADRVASESAADQLVDEFLVAFQDLADFPDIGTPRTYLPTEILAFPHHRWMIFYRKAEVGVDILRVVSGRTDLEQRFKDS